MSSIGPGTLGSAFLEGTEAQTAGFEVWIIQAMDVHSPQLLKTSTVELQAFEAWRDEPDVNEGDVGELAAPFSGDADSTAEGHHQVAEFLAAVEAFVGVAPHAVHGVVGFWLSQDIFEGDLKMVIDVVWITVCEVDFSHG